MRRALMAAAATLIAVVLSGGPASAQTVDDRTANPGVAPATRPATSCEPLPPEAVRAVPAPFDRYMRVMCRDPVGQGLQATEGYHWTAPGGQSIGLSALSATSSPDADGRRQFPASWYVELTPVDLTQAEQRRLKQDFRRAITRRYLDKAVILKLQARTSNGERKLIFLVLPDARPRPAWLIGLECNGACFREDADPPYSQARQADPAFRRTNRPPIC